MKISCGLLINRIISSKDERLEYIKYIESYAPYVDKLYVLDITNQDLDEFYAHIKRYPHVEIAKTDDFGEAYSYKVLYDKQKEDGYDLGMVMEFGYYFEEGCFNALKLFALTKKIENMAIITPAPLYSCQTHERKAETYRPIKGCKLVGVLLNLDIYESLGGFDLEYYQTTFDYDYCIRARLEKKEIILLQNEVLRNINFRLIEKKMFFQTLTTYDKDPMELYYETRNKLFLWDKYKHIDPEYVELDKKLTKAEMHEMRFRDKEFKDKKIMITYAKQDYKKGIKGEYIPRDYF